MGLLNKFRSDRKKKGIEEEVAENLTAILNTKAGYGAWQKEFGLDRCIHASPSSSSIERLVEDIENCIAKYEKRIHVLHVDFVDSDNPLYLRFEISCKIGEKKHAFYIGFTNYPKPNLVEQEGSDGC